VSSGAYQCDECPAGKKQPSTGQYLCLDCAGGKYAATTGLLGCTTCSNGYNSNDGATSCLLAAQDYFLLSNKDGTQSVKTVCGVW
jgi:hypothetical protein